MKTDIELRDYIAIQLMSGTVNDYYTPAYGENIAGDSTKQAIKSSVKRAYIIADEMLKERTNKAK